MEPRQDLTPTQEAGPTNEFIGPAFTIKSVLVGCIGAFSVSAGAAYGTLYLHGSFMALGTSMPGAVFLLFLLGLFINPLLKFIHPRAGLSRRELLVVYIMMVMASPIPTLFVGKFLSAISYPFYYATTENEWRDLIHPHIPDWLMVHDLQVVRKFYEGSGQGELIPWEVWRAVIWVWTPFICALFLMMISLMAIMRKQWIEHERLIYPLMQVPLAMTEEGEKDEKLSPFFKNPMMWAGFAIPALWGTLHGLYNYFPELMPIAHDVDPIRMDVPIFHRTADLYVALRFNIIGFFYFLKTDIAFSLWFFNLLSFFVRGIFGVLGVASTETGGAGHAVHDPFLAYQSMGAILVLFLGGIWTARTHLRGVWRKAFKGDDSIDDSGEILSYRTAVIMFFASSATMVGWLWLAGLPAIFGLAILFLGVVVIFGYSRVVAEGGLSDGSPPIIPAGILVSAVGSSVIGAQGLVVLATTFLWTTGRNFVMVSTANSLRLGEELGKNRRPLFWIIVLALVVAMGGALWMVMILGHKYGAINLWLWSDGSYGYVEKFIRTPSEVYGWGWFNMGLGSLIMTGLMAARWFYIWWPLHPLGYVIGPIWIMDHLWVNMFIAWLIKVIVLKYGGVQLYLKTRPFFMGMILGYFTPGGFYLIIDHFTGMTWNVIFWG
jgi:hypothetical protein